MLQLYVHQPSMADFLVPLLQPVPKSQVSWVDSITLATWIKFVAKYDPSVEVSMNEIYRIFQFCEAPARDYSRVDVTVFGQIFVKIMKIIGMNSRLEYYRLNKDTVLSSTERYLNADEYRALRRNQEDTKGSIFTRSGNRVLYKRKQDGNGPGFVPNKRFCQNPPREFERRGEREHASPPRGQRIHVSPQRNKVVSTWDDNPVPFVCNNQTGTMQAENSAFNEDAIGREKEKEPTTTTTSTTTPSETL
jgi:hypothetical protein